MIPLSRMPQTGFMTAPAGISPWVTYLERAMSSLRASATIEMRRVRPRSEPTRWRNQQLRALAGWYLTVVDAATLPWAGSQPGISGKLPSVLKLAEQTLKVKHGSELRANALEPH